MTVVNPGGDSRIHIVELHEDRIVVGFRDGSSYFDLDVADERREGARPTVDAFFQPQGSIDSDRYVVREGPGSDAERFRRDARRWGPVREEFASIEERGSAQMRFNYATALTERVLRDFRGALENGRVRIDGNALFYEDGGEWRTFRLGPDSLLIQGHDGMHVSITNPALLESFAEALAPWRQVLANLSK